MALYQIQNQAQSVIADKASYTFSDYFKLNAYVEDIVAYFGYNFQAQRYLLPQKTIDSQRVQQLAQRLDEWLPYVNLTNEIAKREFLIAPIVQELIYHTHARAKIEFPLKVNDKLQGTIDYFLQSEQNLVIIEAKNGDLDRGFTQLAVELIALDQWTQQTTHLLYGVVSVGNVWQFGILNRKAKTLTQDLNVYGVPGDLEDLLKSLVAILKGEG